METSTLEELNRVLDRIRDVAEKPQISEDEESERELKERSRRGRGPSIVYSSRISELEAQLTQVRLELRKAQDEAAYLNAHSKPIQPPVSQQSMQQLESLQRERDDLSERVASLQALVGQLRDKEASATTKVKRSLEVVDQAQFDKNQVMQNGGCLSCGFCHAKGKCPAFRKRCSRCRKYNHFAKMCDSNPRNSQYHQTQDDRSYETYSSDNDEYSSAESTVLDTYSESSIPVTQRKPCKNCGNNHPYGKCPAHGNKCEICNKRNHFAKVCHSNPRNQGEDTSDGSSVKDTSRKSSIPVSGRKPCKNCGRNHPYGKCPAHGKKCFVCNKLNHFAELCPSDRVNQGTGAESNYSTPCASPTGVIPNNYNQMSGSNNVPNISNVLASPNQAANSTGPVSNYSSPCGRHTGAIPKNYYQMNDFNLVPNISNVLASQNQVDNSKCFLSICTYRHDVTVALKNCGHQFFRNCLAKVILESEQGLVRCPSLNKCSAVLPLPEIQEILTPVEYDIFISAEKEFHCRTPGCSGWCTYRNTMFFHCPSCTKVNCLMCKNIHSKGPCKKLEEILNYYENNTAALKKREARTNLYPELLDLSKLDIVLYADAFQCPICFEDYGRMEGVILKECLHMFCRECLRKTITFWNEDVDVKCPFRDDEYTCTSFIQEHEIKALLSTKEYETRLSMTLSLAEKKSPNSFHCKTPDCSGWCEIVEDAEEFVCPICFEENCIICSVIHRDKTCEEYQNSLFNEMSEYEIQRLINQGTAMKCPKCGALISKIEGCDGVVCSFCRLDICWVTKRPRWGPGGKGDWSGGCRCNYNNIKCHPACTNCH